MASAKPGAVQFVVAFERNNKWHFHEYTPEEFMNFSTIPPFKIFFDVPVNGKKATQNKTVTKSIKLTEKRLRVLAKVFDEFRKENKKST